MFYIVIFILLLIAELFYFKIADRFNIIDKPNERSSHSAITIRGGGIIFYLGALAYFIISGFNYPWFFLGLTLMTLVSFLDDIITLSNRVRLVIHFISVGLLAYQLGAFDLAWYVLPISFIIVVGVINAYNFMDGINGITASYSLAVGSLLFWVNQDLNFIESDLLVYTLIGVLVFAIFNFRNKAKAFAGDVGSVSIAFILLFALGTLIIKTQEPLYMLFLTVYGIDSVLTIVRRLRLGENIFQAHRSHLYQYLGNEAGVNKLFISFLYGALQFIIGLAVIYFVDQSATAQIIFASLLLGGLSVVYIFIKNYIIQRFVKTV